MIYRYRDIMKYCLVRAMLQQDEVLFGKYAEVFIYFNCPPTADQLVGV